MGTDCPFDTLGVGTDATGDEIRAAYRARLKATHPDHGGDRGELDRVLAAYAELRCQGALERRRPRNDPYARSLRSLDQAAALTVRRQRIDVDSLTTDPGRRVRTRRRPSDRFAEILQVELRRQSSVLRKNPAA